MNRIPLSVWLFLAVNWSVTAPAWAAAQPMVDLDAANLAEGPIAAWSNAGSLGGSFQSDGTNPQVKVIDGVKAVDFGGRDRMVADFNAPAGITGDRPWTCVVRVYARDVSRERTLVSWSNRPDNCLEIEYGDAVLWGALGTWSPNTTGWGDGLPEPRRWHTLIYTFGGGRDGEFHAWCDGILQVRKKFSLATKDGRPFVLGACMAGEPGPNPGFTHCIDGAIASMKIYDHPFTPIESWNASGLTSAYPMAPEHNARLQTLTASLEWAAGSPGVASYDIYLGMDRTAVEKADSRSPAGEAVDWGKVYKGRQSSLKTAFGPIGLDVGKTYFWRVDQLDGSGNVGQRGTVSAFSTGTGNADQPAPADGYIFVEGGQHVLGWKPGGYAVRQNIYFGESAEAVGPGKKPLLADLAPAVASVPVPVKSPVLGKTYYWRIESINDGKLSVSQGDVWSFRTVKKKLKVYLSAGQSNAVGCSSVRGIPQDLKGFHQSVIIFVRGECRLGEYGWAYLRDGLGSAFGDSDGRGTFGPELSFGHLLGPRSPDTVLAILKCAWGGTNLGVQWRPPSAGGETGPLYKGFIEAVHLGISRLDPAFEPEFAGMIWMQGESDSGDQKMAEDYARNLTCLINDIRAEIRKPDLPFVHAQISKAPAWEPRGGLIRDAELAVTKSVPHTATFATDDYGMCDPWHYDTPGMVSLGERFAAAMQGLEKSQSGR